MNPRIPKARQEYEEALAYKAKADEDFRQACSVDHTSWAARAAREDLSNARTRLRYAQVDLCMAELKPKETTNVQR